MKRIWSLLAVSIAVGVAIGALPLSPATALTPLAPPTGFHIFTQPDRPVQLNLAWTDPTPNDPDSETGFEVWRCAGATCSDFVLSQTVASPISAFGATESGLAEGTTYTYRVRAVRGAEVSDWSATASGTTSYLFPEAPSGVTASYVGADRGGNNGNVSLSWVDNATTEASYRVTRCVNSNCLVSPVITTLPADSSSFTDPTVMDGEEYVYLVSAVGLGGSAYTATAAGVFITPGVGLPAPTRLTARNTRSGIALSWRNNTSSGGVQVWRCVDAFCRNLDGTLSDRSSSWTLLTTTARGATSYVDQTAAGATTYSYRIRAYSASMASPFAHVTVTRT